MATAAPVGDAIGSGRYTSAIGPSVRMSSVWIFAATPTIVIHGPGTFCSGPAISRMRRPIASSPASSCDAKY